VELCSTKDHGIRVSFREALIRGIAPDGGLYIPITVPRISEADLESWRSRSFADLSIAIAERVIGDEFAPDVIRRLVGGALDFPVPIVEVEPDRYVLELFHGPTLAFKDFGARFLARFFGHILAERDEYATILVATSGDTGGAVAHGFHGVPNVRVVVLYPEGKVSPFQEAQMATLGGNVTAVRVWGDFDDCQRLVKQAFLDRRLADMRLSSANSINIGRLLPQSFYYVSAWLSVTARGPRPTAFSVPSGNLGNVTAGVLAASIGVPIAWLVAATNINRTLDEFMATGAYRPRPSVATMSSAMDVGDPSNLPRLVALGPTLDDLRSRVSVSVVDDETTRQRIRDVYERTGYVLDPHGAVGYEAAVRFARDRHFDGPIVTLATAHPAKFGSAIRNILGFAPELPGDAFRDLMSKPLAALDLDDTSYGAFEQVLRDLPDVRELRSADPAML
jgi:threonine synthase